MCYTHLLFFTALKKMKLLYDTNSDSTRYSHKIGTLSKEIIENGINLMPELQVTLAYDHYSAVASGKKLLYVKFRKKISHS